MDPSKFTQKVTEILNASQELAQEHQHQSLTPVHVAIVLFEVRGSGVAFSLPRDVCRERFARLHG
jgi:ATP-dependent Clp protease ATP-binding subunit ClpA